MRFLYIVTRGTGDPTAASVPLHMAVNGSLEVGQDVTVLFAGDGAEILLEDNAETIQGIGVPPMKELLAGLKDRATVYV
ncbi:MAG TPA: DsrE family protein [Actinomycetota bacterium]